MRNNLGYFDSLGIVVEIMARSPRYCGYPLAVITEWIRPAILLNQIIILYEHGIAVGYMTWALLTEDTEDRLINDPRVRLHLSEWNEGDRLWIMDMAVRCGEFRRFLDYALVNLGSSYATAKYLRRRDDGSVRKVVAWRRIFANKLVLEK